MKRKQSKPASRRSKTDWKYVDALKDKDIRKAAASDPDAAPLDLDWSKAELVIPKAKEAISIRLDTDILEYLRGEGPGYQRRINAILRTYVDAKAKSSRFKKRA